MTRRHAVIAAVLVVACRDVTAPLRPAASIEAPDSIVILEGDTVRVSGRLLDSAGNPLTTPLAWTSEDTVVVTVSPNGLVRFRQPGWTNLIALGDGLIRRVAVRAAGRFEKVFAGAGFNAIPWCAISIGGATWCFRSDAVYAQLANSLLRLRTPGGKSATMISVQSEHECGLLSGGTPVCWPYLSTAILGDPAAPATTPIDSAVTPIVTGPFIYLSGAYGHNCAVDASGAGWCWGYNFGRPDPYGDLHPGSVLGTGDTTRFLASAPLRVSGGLHLTAIAAGVQHTCALDPAGAAWCWGSNLYGQLGAGALAPTGPSNSAVPVRVAGTQTYTAIAAGGFHTCAIAQDGTPWCWGDIAGGPPACRSSCSAAPRQISAAIALVSISAGGDAGESLSCGLTATGIAYCWGDNFYGEVGDGTTTPRLTPVPVGIGSLKQLSAGTYGACGVTVSGVGYCWGGRLGNSPVRLPFQP